MCIRDRLTGIGDNAFFNCVNLKNVKIPSKVTVIPSSAFSGCSSLSNIELPAGLTAINTAAFSACSSLQNITLPEGLETIGESAFAACVSLKNIDFPDSLTSIGVSAFSDCDSLISVTIPSKVKKLYRETFRHCNQLQHVIIPDSVAEMEAWVFANCPSLETVMMPASILMSKIGSNIFLESPNVTAIVKEKSGAYSYCVNNKVDYRIVKNNVEISQSALEMRKGTKKELSLVTVSYTHLIGLKNVNSFSVNIPVDQASYSMTPASISVNTANMRNFSKLRKHSNNTCLLYTSRCV